MISARYGLSGARLAIGRFGLCALVVVQAAAWGGEFNEANGLAIKGYDSVAYFTDNKPVLGRGEFATVFKGSTFHFSSAANRDAFIASPEKYAPQYAGYCAFGTTRGYKADIDPSAFSVVDGKLYLNYNADVRTMWNKDPAEFIRKADEKWPEVEKTTKIMK